MRTQDLSCAPFTAMIRLDFDFSIVKHYYQIGENLIITIRKVCSNFGRYIAPRI